MLYDEIFDEWDDQMFGLGKKKIDKAAWNDIRNWLTANPEELK